MLLRDPLKRQVWLKVWFSTLEKAETENRFVDFDETEEDDLLADLDS